MSHSREGGSEATVPVPGAISDIYLDEAAGLDPAYRAKAMLLNTAIQEMGQEEGQEKGKKYKLGKYQVRP